MMGFFGKLFSSAGSQVGSTAETQERSLEDSAKPAMPEDDTMDGQLNGEGDGVELRGEDVDLERMTKKQRRTEERRRRKSALVALQASETNDATADLTEDERAAAGDDVAMHDEGDNAVISPKAKKQRRRKETQVEKPNGGVAEEDDPRVDVATPGAAHLNEKKSKKTKKARTVNGEALDTVVAEQIDTQEPNFEIAEDTNNEPKPRSRRLSLRKEESGIFTSSAALNSSQEKIPDPNSLGEMVKAARAARLLKSQPTAELESVSDAQSDPDSLVEILKAAKARAQSRTPANRSVEDLSLQTPKGAKRTNKSSSYVVPLTAENDEVGTQQEEDAREDSSGEPEATETVRHVKKGSTKRKLLDLPEKAAKKQRTAKEATIASRRVGRNGFETAPALGPTSEVESDAMDVDSDLVAEKPAHKQAAKKAAKHDATTPKKTSTQVRKSNISATCPNGSKKPASAKLQSAVTPTELSTQQVQVVVPVMKSKEELVNAFEFDDEDSDIATSNESPQSITKKASSAPKPAKARKPEVKSRKREAKPSSKPQQESESESEPKDIPKSQKMKKARSTVKKPVPDSKNSKKDGSSKVKTSQAKATAVKGPFPQEEIDNILAYCDTWRDQNDMTQFDFNDMIHTDAKSESEKNQTKKEFFHDLFDEFPQYPREKLRNLCRRKLHNFGARGVFTKEQDKELRALAEQYPGNWKQIGALMNRFSEDCRDRWRNWARWGDAIAKGGWTPEEEDELTKVVGEFVKSVRDAQAASDEPDSRIAAASDDSLIDWMTIAERMGGRRGRQQCSKHWSWMQDRTRDLGSDAEDPSYLAPIVKLPEMSRFKTRVIEARNLPAAQKLNLLYALRDCGSPTETKVPWLSRIKMVTGLDQLTSRITFRCLKEQIPDWKEKRYKDILPILIDAFETASPNEPPGFEVSNWSMAGLGPVQNVIARREQPVRLSQEVVVSESSGEDAAQRGVNGNSTAVAEPVQEHSEESAVEEQPQQEDPAELRRRRKQEKRERKERKLLKKLRKAEKRKAKELAALKASGDVTVEQEHEIRKLSSPLHISDEEPDANVEDALEEIVEKPKQHKGKSMPAPEIEDLVDIDEIQDEEPKFIPFRKRRWGATAALVDPTDPDALVEDPIEEVVEEPKKNKENRKAKGAVDESEIVVDEDNLIEDGNSSQRKKKSKRHRGFLE